MTGFSHPDYLRVRAALEKHLSLRGLTGWTNKLPPEFVMAATEALKGLVGETRDE